MEDKTPSFNVSAARIGFVLSVIALLTFGFQMVSYVKAQEFTVAAHTQYIADDKAQTKEILDELKRLNDTVTELVVIARGSKK